MEVKDIPQEPKAPQPEDKPEEEPLEDPPKESEAFTRQKVDEILTYVKENTKSKRWPKTLAKSPALLVVSESPSFELEDLSEGNFVAGASLRDVLTKLDLDDGGFYYEKLGKGRVILSRKLGKYIRLLRPNLPLKDPIKRLSRSGSALRSGMQLEVKTKEKPDTWQTIRVPYEDKNLFYDRLGVNANMKRKINARETVKTFNDIIVRRIPKKRK